MAHRQTFRWPTGTALSVFALATLVTLAAGDIFQSSRQAPVLSIDSTVTADRKEQAIALPHSTDDAQTVSQPPVAAALLTPLVGSLDGEAQNSQGSLLYSLPLEVPAGPRGIKPSLALTYNNGSFSLSGMSAITRCAAVESIDGYSGSVRHDQDDEFCVDGQRILEKSDGTYTLQQHNYSRIQAVGGSADNPDHWVFHHANGEVVRYGHASSSRELNATDNATTAWFLSDRRDPHGVDIRYSYQKPSGSVRRIDKIQYSAHEISFVHEDIGLDTTRYRPRGGGAYQTNDMLSRVEIRTDNGLRRSYKLDYGDTKGTARPTLMAVELCDENNSCLPPTKFSYAPALPDTGLWRNERTVHPDNLFVSYDLVDVTGDGIAEVCHLNFAYSKDRIDSGDNYEDFVDTQLKMRCGDQIQDTGLVRSENGIAPENTLRWLDLNDDGFTDYCLTVKDGTYCAINAEGTLPTPTLWSNITSTVLEETPEQYHFGNREEQSYTDAAIPAKQLQYIDINHDRLPDHCVLSTTALDCTNQVPGSKFTGASSSFPIDLPDVSKAAFVDINADGRPDLCAAVEGEGFSCHLEIGTQNQHAYGARVAWTSDQSLADADDDLPRDSLTLLDYNSDGLIDACYYDDNQLWCLINNGSGFEPRTQITSVAASHDIGWGSDKDRGARSLQYVDLNTDGLVDVCLYNGRQTLNCGFGQSDGRVSAFKEYRTLEPFSGTLPKAKSINIIIYANGIVQEFDVSADPVKFVDTDGDGMVDICYRGPDGLRCATTTGTAPSRYLTGVESAFHHSTFEYASPYDNAVALYTHDATVVPGLHGRYPGNMLLHKIVSDNPGGGKSDLTFAYQGMRVDPVRGHQLFARIENTQSVTGAQSITEYHQQYPLQGQAKASRAHVNGQLMQDQGIDYFVQRDFNHAEAYAVLTQETVTRTYDVDGTLLDTRTATRSAYENNYGMAGNIKEVSNDALTGAAYTVETSNAYRHDTSRWLLGLLETVNVTHSGPTGTLYRNTAQTFDPVSGSLTGVTLEPSSSDSRVTLYKDFDSFGNAKTVQQKSAAGKTRSVSTVFDANGLNPSSVTNALGHEATWSYDNFCAKPLLYIGPNGGISSWKYDGLCREIHKAHADGTKTITNYTASEGISRGIAEADTSKVRVDITTTGQPAQTTYVDGWGNTLRSVRTGFQGKPVRTEALYNERGLLKASGQPYQVESFSDSDSGYAVAWTQHIYDAFGRTERIEQPSDTGLRVTTMAYSGRASTTTDAVGSSRTLEQNLRGDSATITEADGSVLTHVYDAMGNLTDSKRNGIVSTHIEYDEFNQKTRSVDQAMGTWGYTYTGFGELETQTDANLETTTFVYDALGRVESKDTAGVISNYAYDTADNGLGKLHKAIAPERTTIYGYDSVGRVTETVDQVGGDTYTQTVDFDNAGRPYLHTYPGDIEIQRNYNAHGYLDSMSMPLDQLETPDVSEIEKTIREYTSSLAALQKTADDATAAALKQTELIDAAIVKYEQAVGAIDANNAHIVKLQAWIKDSKLRQARHAAIAHNYNTLASNYRAAHGTRIFDLRYVRADGTRTYRYKKQCGFGKCRYYVDLTARDLEGLYGVGQWPAQLEIGNLYLRQAARLRDKVRLEKEYQARVQASVDQYTGRVAVETTNRTAAEQEKAELVQSLPTLIKQRDDALTDAKSYVDDLRDKVKEANNRLAELTDTNGAVDVLEELRTALLEEQRQGATNVSGEQINSVPKDHVPFWAVTRMDPAGRIAGQVTGNGVLSSRTYDQDTGELRKIKTVRGNTLLSEHDYTYYANQSVQTSSEKVAQIDRSFQYDAMDQLTYFSERHGIENASVPDINVLYDYDSLGNKRNNIAGDSFSYDPVTGRLESMMRPDGTTEAFQYDNNGNTLSGNGRRVSWTAFNKPALIEMGAVAANDQSNTINNAEPEYRPDTDGVITVEAENGLLEDGVGAARWARTTDAGASDGASVQVEGYNNWSALNGSKLTVPVTITASGEYQIYFRAKNLSAGEKSFWLMVDDQPIGPSGGKIYFHDEQWHWWNSYGKSNLSLSAGKHTITLVTRSANFALDPEFKF